MATYRIKGQRWLRKYTAKRSSPVYAAAVDAQAVVDAFCDVPWERVAEKDAGMTSHTDEVVDEESKITGLDMNVIVRDSFDAALFCAGHVGGQHRAYANAAVYRYEMPAAAVGVSLSSLCVQVTSDPYNSRGARLHVFTNSTGEIPMNCHTLRGEDSLGEVIDDGTTAAAVAPRTVVTSGGTDYWYPTVETATLSPTGGMVLQKYLFVLVALESYSTARGNWLEGCSFIRNLVDITTAAAVPGWTDGATYDLSVADSSFHVAHGGILPAIPANSFSGVRRFSVRTDANAVSDDERGQIAAREASGLAVASALHRLYAGFFNGEGVVELGESAVYGAGAAFTISREARALPDAYGRASPPKQLQTGLLALTTSVLLVPFVFPVGRRALRLRLAFPALSCSPGAEFIVRLMPGEYATSLSEDFLKNPELYIPGDALLPTLGAVSSGDSATFPLDGIPGGRVGTVVISGWMPPEAYDLADTGTQGTGTLMPDVTIL